MESWKLLFPCVWVRNKAWECPSKMHSGFLLILKQITWVLSLHSSPACLGVLEPKVSSRTEVSLKSWQKNGPCFENLWNYFYPNKRKCHSDCEQESCRELWERLDVLRFHVWSRGTFTGLEGSLRVSQPPPHPEPLRTGFPKTFPDIFWYLHGWGIHNFSGNPYRCSGMLSVEKVFPDVRGDLLSYSLCPLPFVLALGSTEKSLFPSSLYLLQLFKYLSKIPSSLLQAKQSWVSCGRAFFHVSNTSVN